MSTENNLYVCEGGNAANLRPLSWTRPVYNLICGVNSLLDKIIAAYGSPACYLGVRPYLAELASAGRPLGAVNQLPRTGALVINGRALWSPALAAAIPLDGPEGIYISGETIIAARLDEGTLADLDPVNPLSSLPDHLPVMEGPAEVINHPWELAQKNAAQLRADSRHFGDLGRHEGEVHPAATLINRAGISLGSGANIGAGVVLNAEDGPIIIAAGVTIEPNAVLEGPLYIGAHSLVRAAARLYGGTSIGESCKVGGEISHAIIHGHSNKQHDGFLGHAYLGEWVNLGAGTTNSDLKNDYGTVRMSVSGGEPVDTGEMFVGSLIGDHTKTGIGMLLNTGAVLGVGCNLYGGGLAPDYVPSFSWGTPGRLTTYRMGKFLAVAATVMARRSISMTPANEKMLREVADLTAPERSSYASTD